MREALAETAEIARAEEDYWENAVAMASLQVREGSNQPDAGATLDLAQLIVLPLALQRRVLRAAAESLGLRLEFQQVEEILDAAGPKVTLPGGWVVLRRAGELKFARVAAEVMLDYEYCLAVPGRVEVPEVGAWFEAALVPENGKPGYNPENLLAAKLLTKELRVRNWRAGDRFWPAHTKSAKKIKELLQERHVSGSERKLWPVVVSGDEVIWMRGFAGAAESRLREVTHQAVVIREVRK